MGKDYSFPSWIFLLLCIFPAPFSAQQFQTFSIGLYKTIAKTSLPDENIALSPFSAGAALSMTLVGAGGTTQSELSSTLGVTASTAKSQFSLLNTASADFTLQSANAIFLEKTYSINPGFRTTIVNDFGGNISSVDFVNKAEEARVQINSFVEEKTNNKISNLFSAGSLESNTKLVLVNAVYFKADWMEKFTKEWTQNRSFAPPNGPLKDIQLMTQQGMFGYTESAALGGSQLLELKYKGGSTSMIIILPKTVAAIQSLENALTAETLETALEQMADEAVDVFLPKFKVEASYQLAKPLIEMGIKAAFANGADFSGINAKKDLLISKVVQKVFVHVDEDGTEAAAATGVMMSSESAVEFLGKPKVFRADRPFLYLIRHNPSKAILFMGRLSNPSGNAN